VEEAEGIHFLTMELVEGDGSTERARVRPAVDARGRGRRVGDMDDAIAIAQRALDERDPLFVLLARTWLGFDRLRSDARFIDIVGRLHLPGWQP